MKGTGMKLFKLITGGLLLAIVGLFIYQNLNTFRGPVAFSLDLYIHEPFPWSHNLYTVIGIAALLGFVLGILVMLTPYRNARRRLLSARQDKPPVAETPSAPPPASPADPQAALAPQEKSDQAGPE
jgi:hypothetical protein